MDTILTPFHGEMDFAATARSPPFIPPTPQSYYLGSNVIDLLRGFAHSNQVWLAYRYAYDYEIFQACSSLFEQLNATRHELGKRYEGWWNLTMNS